VSACVIMEQRDRQRWLRLNRPDKANALSLQLMAELTAEIRQCEIESEVRSVVITGAGARVFCAGVDVREMPADGDVADHRKRRAAALAGLLDALLDSTKPVIAVLNGIASGGGAMAALCADMRIAVDDAALALPEINLGLPTFTGAAFANHYGGLALAVDLVQSGRRMPAAEACARGLFNRVVARDVLERVAGELAEELGSKDAATYAANRRWLMRPLREALAAARAYSEQQKRAKLH